MGKRTLQSLCGASEVSSDQTLWKCLLAEFIGTAILVLIACGSCFNRVDASGPDNVIKIALGFGLTVASVAQAVGHVSGGHLNPCVTAGMLVTGNISFVKGFFYVASQCIGAITGAAILQALTPAGFQLGNTTLGKNITPLMGFFIEAAISFVLVLTVFGATDTNRLDVLGSVPLAIGLSITVCHLFAVPLTGSSMNPARTFGPALILQDFTNHHIYWLGPLLGGVAAGLIYRYAFRAPKPNVDDLERAVRLCSLAKMSGKEPDGGVTSF
ncbi:aquaporin AQPcic-like [Varroa jacobsoni]|uniref:Uncharacterized protein n=1 Tax=Varroa destructor TaxID=109461 RepID=A0A7M7JH54_VARDE|nr:aquaporin AQPcic-like [Varroa destructor]XP_022652092.1 aquaporin AQPcic-like [Varroa destructor]XP_022652093.1 aquaporin AQPcic-like [Varroa destructor]XP_022652094.1 aquaporin AQPcic-like [Varroa destructor]XP_022652095.1 aquaporin AQPcic-like [Varroa destructor]XP_022691403.1 aquaporin AQPcic-like [Varroa jacobsoni]XP_022691404.1 aquaporin AQPcic-like [Varroa jacobsoni]XP_022691405.1 aquaporin AQPcic-like [Varroa jacobsoni]XP_022691406.1 aquaporin AQPcic-like [Varroa jacobsoni]XP_022